MSLKTVFFGTPQAARTSLVAMLQAGYDISAVVTQPDRRAGRGRKFTPPPVKIEAQSRSIPIVQPESVKSQDFITVLKEIKPDLLVVIAFGQILPQEILDIPSIMPVNVHYSLLPRWRGSAPVNWAIASGDTITGVTTMRMEKNLDSGPILLQREIAILPDETAGELMDRLAVVGSEVLLDTVFGLKNNSISELPQNDQIATFARMLKKSDGKVNFYQDSSKTAMWGRGMSPWPGAFVRFNNNTLKIFDLSFDDYPAVEEPGTVVDLSEKGLKIACRHGHLYIGQVQHPGKKPVSAKEALMGSGPKAGDILE